jgi:hypothetical protein
MAAQDSPNGRKCQTKIRERMTWFYIRWVEKTRQAKKGRKSTVFAHSHAVGQVSGRRGISQHFSREGTGRNRRILTRNVSEEKTWEIPHLRFGL